MVSRRNALDQEGQLLTKIELDGPLNRFEEHPFGAGVRTASPPRFTNYAPHLSSVTVGCQY